jgi:ParB family chromosome partitioning protein
VAKKGLGRGLEAILGEPHQERTDRGRVGAGVALLPTASIQPDPDQPRKRFGEEEIGALADSIRAQGILQPLLVTPAREDGLHVIIAGERRWRAAQKAELHEVPVLVREVGPDGSAEIALIENVQRVDLNPIEEADAYARLRDVFGRKPQEIADSVGKSRSHVANMLRLTALPPEVRAMVVEGTLSMGHARALLTAEDPYKLAKQVAARDLSVRETERLAQPKKPADSQGPTQEPKRAPKPPSGTKDADTKALERDLEAALGLTVAIDHQGKAGGEVRIDYQTLDQLDEICSRLMGTGI